MLALLPELILTGLTQAPALRALVRYAPLPGVLIPALLCCVCLGVYLLRHPPQWMQKILVTAWPTGLLLAVLAVAVAVVYPLADGLKFTGGGADADNAIQVGAVALWQLNNPYGLTTYFGNPLSPGPGWLWLYGPLALLNLQPLGLPLAAAFCAGALRQAGHGWGLINTLLLIIFSSLGVWELTATGNDLPVWGLLLVGLLALLTMPRLSKRNLVLLTVAVGCMATARLPFLYLPLLIGFSLLAVWPTRALVVAGGGLLLALGLHAGFWWWHGGAYPPLHLLSRGSGLLSGSTLYTALAVGSITAIAMLYHWRWWPPATHVALGLGVPLALLATAELATHGAFSRWEGANFLLPALPISIFAVLKHWPQKSSFDIRNTIAAPPKPR